MPSNPRCVYDQKKTLRALLDVHILLADKKSKMSVVKISMSYKKGQEDNSKKAGKQYMRKIRNLRKR